MLRKAAWRQPDHNFIYWLDRKLRNTYAQAEIASTQAVAALETLEVKKIGVGLRFLPKCGYRRAERLASGR